MKKSIARYVLVAAAVFAVVALFAFALRTAPVTAYAAEDAGVTVGAEETVGTDESGESGKIDISPKAMAAGIAVGIAAVAGALAMAIAIAKSVESMARQPEAAGKINSAMMLGLVFIETTILYALIVAILIIFVL